jgi:heptosyltransferase III
MSVRSNRKGRPKVLVYLFGSLGDTVVAIPALRAVRRHFPNRGLLLLQNTQAEGIVRASDVIPEDLIDRYLNYSSVPGGNRLSVFLQLWRNLRKERFNAAAYLVISERASLSVLRDKLFFRSCGIRELIGFHAFGEDVLFPLDDSGHPARSQHEADRKLDRLKQDGVEVRPVEDLLQPWLTYSDDEAEPIRQWLAGRRRKPASRLVAIAPGCKTVANQWPYERFVEVGRRLTAEMGCEIVMSGGKAEAEISEKIVSDIGSGINAAGMFSVRESGILLSLCDLYVGLDTGTTHLAAAVGTPCFAIYGQRNNPGHWYPHGGEHRVLTNPVECAGCRQFGCPLPGHPCMVEISVEMVWAELRSFIADLGGWDSSAEAVRK